MSPFDSLPVGNAVRGWFVPAGRVVWSFLSVLPSRRYRMSDLSLTGIADRKSLPVWRRMSRAVVPRKLESNSGGG